MRIFPKTNASKKNIKKQQKAVEDAKSPEQKAYEKMQEEETENAHKLFVNLINVLREMGWRVVPTIMRSSEMLPEQFIAQVGIEKIPHFLHVQIQEAIAKQNAAKEGTPESQEGAQEAVEDEKCPEAQEEDPSAS